MEYICTDPNTGQFGRKISDTTFEFYENDPTNVVTINIQNYTYKAIENIITAYGYTLGETEVAGYVTNIDELYGIEANWIIAECIFETLHT